MDSNVSLNQVPYRKIACRVELWSHGNSTGNPNIQIERRDFIGHVCKLDVYIPLIEFSSFNMWHARKGCQDFWKRETQLVLYREIERVVHYIELIYSYFLHSLKWITRIDCQTDKLRVQQRCTWLRYATLNTIYRYYLYVSHTCQNFPETSKQCTIRQKFFRIFFFPNNGRCVTVRINETIKICIELIQLWCLYNLSLPFECTT